MSFNPALFRGLRGSVTTVTTCQIQGGDSKKDKEPSNGAACTLVSPLSPPSPPKNEWNAKKAESPREDNRQLILEAARAAYFEHREVCSICCNSWSESERCAKHAELWQLYESALVGVHGAEKVIGATSTVSDPPPACPKAPPAVPTAPLWHALRDAYYSHRFSCEHCRPTGECPEGRRLKNAYKVFNH